MKTLVHACLAVALAAGSATAAAGPYSDEMARCLVRATTSADRTMLVRWMFAAATLHPEVRSLAAVSPAQREELNRGIAALFERLLAESCVTQSQEAAKYEGGKAFESSFEVLGQVAGRELFSHPQVGASMADMLQYLNKQKLENLFGGARK